MKTKFNFSRSTLNAALLCFSLAAAGPTSAFEAPGRPAAPSLHPESGQWLSKIPKGFIPNVGQWRNGAVRFGLRDSGATAFFTDEGFVLWNGQTTTTTKDGREIRTPVAPRWQLVGARPVEPVGGETFKHTVSFFRGNDPAKWRANVPAYRELHYQEILQGVDLHVESREHGFEYTFHVEPHAKPELRLRYDGVTGLEKSLTGDLIVRTATGHFTESRPVSFQVIEGRRQEVPSAFEIVSANEYRIAVGPYDERHALVIDPVLDWSTFLGGNYIERFWNVASDSAGNIIVAGDSYSTDFPDTAGFSSGPGLKYDASADRWYEDAIVAKFTPDGTQLFWVGYLTGNGLTGDSVGQKGLTVNSAGDVFVAGLTDSPDFPTTGGVPHSGGSDAFVAKIAANGSALLWSFLLGGGDDDMANAIALDAQEDVYVAGLTRSMNFPTTPNAFAATLGGAQDAFVAKFDASGNRLWSSYLGGNSGAERAIAIVSDSTGGILVFGDTESSDFPANVGDTILGGGDDAFIAKLASDGTAILWATLLGGSGNENDLPTGPVPPTSLNTLLRLNPGRGDMTLDNDGNVLVVGQTYSADFPVTPGAFRTTRSGNNDGYVAKIAADGTHLLWASYLGGSGGTPPDGREEFPWDVAVNPWNEVFVIGWTYSTDFPTTPGALKISQLNAARTDGFLTKLSANGAQLLYSTYLGGNENDDTALGLAYGSGNVLVTGWAAASTFPITAGTYQPGCVSCAQAYVSDGFVMKFLDAFIAQDGFESGNYSGGTGWAGSWTASGDVSILTSSEPHSGSRHARLRRGTGLLSRTVNIPAGSTTLQLGFWSKVHSFEGTEHANVKVNGATVLSLTSAPSFNDNTYHYYEFDLISYVGAGQIQITFDANMGDQNDNWYLDDIRLTGTSAPVPPVADAGPDLTVTAGDGFATVTLNGSGSFDPDGGSIELYQWATQPASTDPMFIPTLAVGTHTITLTVTDDEGATDTDTVVVQVNPAPAQPTQSHVGDLDGSASNQGATKWKATVVVTIHDNASPTHQLVPGATVTGTWSGGFTGTVNATTGANGQCSFTTGQMPKTGTSNVTFTINNVQHASLTYNATANHDPESDSNGTSVTVNKP